MSKHNPIRSAIIGAGMVGSVRARLPEAQSRFEESFGSARALELRSLLRAVTVDDFEPTKGSAAVQANA